MGSEACLFFGPRCTSQGPSNAYLHDPTRNLWSARNPLVLRLVVQVISVRQALREELGVVFLFTSDSCVGYGVCRNDGQCGWECGDVSCRDLALPVPFGEFGFCEMILGFGVVDGECASISGCERQGQVLHDSLDACEATCES